MQRHLASTEDRREPVAIERPQRNLIVQAVREYQSIVILLIDKEEYSISVPNISRGDTAESKRGQSICGSVSHFDVIAKNLKTYAQWLKSYLSGQENTGKTCAEDT